MTKSAKQLSSASLLPFPMEIVSNAGCLQLKGKTLLLKNNFAEQTVFAANLLMQHVDLKSSDSDGVLDVEFVVTASQSAESYQIDINEAGIRFTASDSTGFLYAVQSFLQLLENFADELPCGIIKDEPRFQWRGFMLDSARNFQSLDVVKRCLDWLSALKINRFHWHLVDSEGWRIEIKKYPRLTEVGSCRGHGDNIEKGFYSQADIKEIIKYADERGITVIPEIEMPAHSNAAIYCYPELSCSGKDFEATDIVHTQYGHSADEADVRNFCAGKEIVFDFLQDVLAEVIELFPAKWIHVGGDERLRDIWDKCPHCLRRMKEEGLNAESELQLYFMNRICSFVHNKGRIPIMWAENPELGMPDHAIIQAWRGDEKKVAAKAGKPVICSNNPYFYLDYYQYSHQKGVDWLTEMKLEKVYNYDVTDELSASEAKTLLGLEAPLWTSWVEHWEIDEYMFPRILAVAENAWRNDNKEKDFNEFTKRCDFLEKYFNKMGARYSKPLEERPLRTFIPGASVETQLSHEPGFMPEKALDCSLYHYFWSENKPVAGNTFTVKLKNAQKCSSIKVYTGKTGDADGVPKGAVFETSENGINFVKTDILKKRNENFQIDMPAVKAFRLKFNENSDQKLVIRGFSLES